jgi:hypothetical protein
MAPVWSDVANAQIAVGAPIRMGTLQQIRDQGESIWQRPLDVSSYGVASYLADLPTSYVDIIIETLWLGPQHEQHKLKAWFIGNERNSGFGPGLFAETRMLLTDGVTTQFSNVLVCGMPKPQVPKATYGPFVITVPNFSTPGYFTWKLQMLDRDDITDSGVDVQLKAAYFAVA